MAKNISWVFRVEVPRLSKAFFHRKLFVQPTRSASIDEHHDPARMQHRLARHGRLSRTPRRGKGAIGKGQFNIGT